MPEAPDWHSLTTEFCEKIWSEGCAANIEEAAEAFLFERGIDLSQLDPELEGHFDRLCKSAKSNISRRIQTAEAHGIRPNLVFSSVSDDLIPFREDAFDRGPPAPLLRETLQREIVDLSPRRFEALSVLVLELEGVVNPTVMRGNKEEGIDFYGVIDLGVRLPGPLWKELAIRVLGQSKKPDVGEETVRLLCEDIRTFSARAGRAFPLTSMEFQDMLTPIVGVIFSAKHVTDPAREYGRARGVTVKDGEQVAELLLRSDVARRRWINFDDHVNPLRRDAFLSTLDDRLSP